LTVYIPFSAPVLWFFSRIRSPVASVTPSSVSPFSNADASVPFAVLAALTACFHDSPLSAASTAAFVKAVVASCVVFVPGDAVEARGRARERRRREIRLERRDSVGIGRRRDLGGVVARRSA
jgi:hypothetical protein